MATFSLESVPLEAIRAHMTLVWGPYNVSKPFGSPKTQNKHSGHLSDDPRSSNLSVNSSRKCLLTRYPEDPEWAVNAIFSPQKIEEWPVDLFWTFYFLFFRHWPLVFALFLEKTTHTHPIPPHITLQRPFRWFPRNLQGLRPRVIGNSIFPAQNLQWRSFRFPVEFTFFLWRIF